MCGIIAGFNSNLKKKNKNQKTEKINEFIVNQYEDQCSRGSKGFGIIRIDNKGLVEIDRATEPTKFLLDLYLKQSNMIIAHHRHPTSTDNKISQTHPILVSHESLQYDYYFIHNGVMTNDSKLKIKHEKLGFKYTTEYQKTSYYANAAPDIKFNDTEALAIEVALFIEEKQETVETDNSAAFMALQVNKKTKKAEKVYFGRSGHSSLNLSIVKGSIKISSEGEGEEVVKDTLWSFDPKNPKMKLSSRGMEFKEKREPVVSTVMITETKNTSTGGTESTKKDDKETEITAQRAWNVEKENFELQLPEEDIFVDKKQYETLRITDLKEYIKNDDSGMVETSLESTLEDDVTAIGDLIDNYKKTLLHRDVTTEERGFYLSQIFTILKAMEKMTSVAEDEYIEKQIEEEHKKQETESEYMDDTGYVAGKRLPKHREDLEDDRQEVLGFSHFG